ncbi:hypothetical protein D3C81_2063810 [compost metagenome]
MQFLQTQQHHLDAFAIELIDQFVAQTGVLLDRAGAGFRLIGPGHPGQGLGIGEWGAITETKLLECRQTADKACTRLPQDSGYLVHRQARCHAGRQVAATQPER